MRTLNKTLLIIMSFIFFGCNNNSKVNLWEEVRKGNQLDQAQELSVSEFFQIWIRRDISWKANMEIMQVYDDKFNVYFYEKLNLKNSAYIGNRHFEKGVEKLFKVNKMELESKFGFYKDFQPTDTGGIDFKNKFLENVGLDRTDLRSGDASFKYDLIAHGVVVRLEFKEKLYQSTYDSNQKRFSTN